MVKQLAKGKERLTNAYWSMVGMASVAMLSLQPVMNPSRKEEIS